MAKFVNSFLLGADPEVAMLDENSCPINAQTLRKVETGGFFGFDHGGYIIEPHPTPNISARQVCNALRVDLDYLHYQYPKFKFRAGAHVGCPTRQFGHVTLGGHVHLDIPTLTPTQIKAMDIVTESFEALDILPSEECRRRSNGGAYGHKGDVRTEHGHVEYRSMCSWLFSRKTTMLSITAIKLAAVAPKSVPLKGMDLGQLQTWFEGFKESDDDVKWILEKGYFDKSLVADPEAHVLSVWRTSEIRGKDLGDAFINRQIEKKVGGVRPGVGDFPGAVAHLLNVEAIQRRARQEA